LFKLVVPILVSAFLFDSDTHIAKSNNPKKVEKSAKPLPNKKNTPQHTTLYIKVLPLGAVGTGSSDTCIAHTTILFGTSTETTSAHTTIPFGTSTETTSSHTTILFGTSTETTS
jgi:hypothetical protein